MLVEGVDDSVLYCFSVLFVIIVVIMFNFVRQNLFAVNQLNPRLHSDSVDDVTRFRDEVLTSDSNESRRRNQQIQCPICLVDSFLPIETNCGHIFCATCIIQYWTHLTSNIFHAKMKCPMCRSPVTCLLPLYSRDQQRLHSSEFGEIFNKINNYNRRFSGAPRSYWDYISDLPILLRHLFNELTSFNDLSIWYRIRFYFLMFVACCYIISPLDILPEAFFGVLGLLDDFLVLLFVAIYVCVLYRQVIANRR